MAPWIFQDAPDVAVIANRKIIDGSAWIAYVSHDSDDGGWQFHTADTGPLDEADAAVVSLEEIVELDQSVTDLADLPFGWYAWRTSRISSWQRSRIDEGNHPD